MTTTPETLTLVKAWTGAQKRLKAADIDSPAIDARLLLEAATGATRTDILTDPHREISADALAMLEVYLARREKREPVARILGRKGFWKLLLNLTPAVLVPRPETECLVDMILKRTVANQALSLADLGTGSGAILLSVLSERPAARGVGTETLGVGIGGKVSVGMAVGVVATTGAVLGLGSVVGVTFAGLGVWLVAVSDPAGKATTFSQTSPLRMVSLTGLVRSTAKERGCVVASGLPRIGTWILLLISPGEKMSVPWVDS